MDSGPAPSGASRNDGPRYCFAPLNLLQDSFMSVPTHIFDPPFNIIRASHAVLDVTNLETSRDFYEPAMGLHVEDRDDTTLYLRGSEEHQHHSLVLRKAVVPGCARLGFKVGNENDLDKAGAFFARNGITSPFFRGPVP